MEVNMKNEYDFSDAVKNPFAGKFNGKYLVTIERGDSEEHFEVTMPTFRKLTEQEKAVLIDKAV